MKKTQTVFVGMSGGVDSSVAALRLKKQGYSVVGVFIKVWHPDFMVCNWEQERLDAMRVAAHLEIPFMTCDAETEYRDEVAKYFIDEYKAGRTPNPDVMCNKEVKFGAFLKFAQEKGADYIATGHYAQRVNNVEIAELHRGKDTNKDQSYFLWTLTQEQLEFTLFPVGDTTKEQIRKEAEKAKIPVAEKKDSQGICFLGHVDIPEFLSHYVELKVGDVLDTSGNVIGTHQGALVYTTGQRHGFTLHNVSNDSQPHFVIARDISKNTITVDTKRALTTTSQQVQLRNVTLRKPVTDTEELTAQFRYRQKPFKVRLKEENDELFTLYVEENVEQPSAGQSCVVYQGSHCIGGGIVV